MTTNQAKKIVKQTLDNLNLPYTKLTARTVSFTDLARDERIFVTVHGWKPNKLWEVLEKTAHANGFFVEAQSSIF